MIPTHNGPYIYACADKLGRELTKDEIIGALDCLAYETELEAAKLRTALRNCLGWTHRAMDLEVGGSMLMAATEHAEEARLLLDSENSDDYPR